MPSILPTRILPQQISACVLPVIHGFFLLKTTTHSNRFVQRKRVRFGLKENDQIVISDFTNSCNFQAHVYTVMGHITTFLVIMTWTCHFSFIYSFRKEMKGKVLIHLHITRFNFFICPNVWLQIGMKGFLQLKWTLFIFLKIHTAIYILYVCLLNAWCTNIYIHIKHLKFHFLVYFILFSLKHFTFCWEGDPVWLSAKKETLPVECSICFWHL